MGRGDWWGRRARRARDYAHGVAVSDAPRWVHNLHVIGTERDCMDRPLRFVGRWFLVEPLRFGARSLSGGTLSHVLALRGRDPSYRPTFPRFHVFFFVLFHLETRLCFFQADWAGYITIMPRRLTGQGGEQCPENQEVAVHLACLQLLGRKKLHSGLVAHASSAQIRER